MGNKDEPKTVVDQSVISHNQSGGVTAHTYINQRPEPHMQVQVLQRPPLGGPSVYLVRLSFIDAYAAGLAEVRGRNVTRMTLIPESGSMISGFTFGGDFIRFPPGRPLRLKVRTSGGEPDLTFTLVD